MAKAEKSLSGALPRCDAVAEHTRKCHDYRQQPQHICDHEGPIEYSHGNLPDFLIRQDSEVSVLVSEVLPHRFQQGLLSRLRAAIKCQS